MPAPRSPEADLADPPGRRADRDSPGAEGRPVTPSPGSARSALAPPAAPPATAPVTATPSASLPGAAQPTMAARAASPPGDTLSTPASPSRTAAPSVAASPSAPTATSRTTNPSRTTAPSRAATPGPVRLGSGASGAAEPVADRASGSTGVPGPVASGRPAAGGADGRPPAAFEYAVIRVVPRVDRGEFVNVGVVLFCRERRFLGARVALDPSRLAALRALAPGFALAALKAELDAIPRVCAGDSEAGPIARLTQAERFHWLVAPASAVVQASPVHAGICRDPAIALDRLLAAAVLPLPAVSRRPRFPRRLARWLARRLAPRLARRLAPRLTRRLTRWRTRLDIAPRNAR